MSSRLFSFSQPRVLREMSPWNTRRSTAVAATDARCRTWGCNPTEYCVVLCIPYYNFIITSASGQARRR
jgi:hypothetical protein